MNGTSGSIAAAPVVIDIRLRQGTFTLDLRQTIDARTVALFGPSGSGKTTTLAAVAGLRRPDDGTIRIGDRLLFDHAQRIDVPPHERRVGYVPQDLALFPHLDVRGNVMYGARPRDADMQAHAPILELLEIGTFLDRPVDSLSGGERQRVALARALMDRPRPAVARRTARGARRRPARPDPSVPRTRARRAGDADDLRLARRPRGAPGRRLGDRARQRPRCARRVARRRPAAPPTTNGSTLRRRARRIVFHPALV